MTTKIYIAEGGKFDGEIFISQFCAFFKAVKITACGDYHEVMVDFNYFMDSGSILHYIGDL